MWFCMSMKHGYRAIHWSTIVLIAGLLPIATALGKTGGVDLIVDNCPLLPNPAQADPEDEGAGDGIGSACEPSVVKDGILGWCRRMRR